MTEKQIDDAAIALKKKKAREYQAAYRAANPEKIKAKRESNREKISKYSAKYYKANTEKLKAKAIAYRAVNQNSEKAKVTGAMYYEKNKETIKAKIKAYQAANREKINVRKAIYRATKKAMTTAAIPTEIKA